MRPITPSLRELATRMYDLYVTDTTRFVKGTEKLGYFIPSLTPLTISVLEDHLSHKYSVSVFAAKGKSKFMAFDVDTGDKAGQDVKTIIDTLSAYGIPRDYIYVSLSGGKGYHVEMFFSDPLPVTLLRRVYEFVCLTNGLNMKKVEFRPTNTQAIKLPLSFHPITERVCWYVDPATLVPIEELTHVLNLGKINASYARGIILTRFPHVVDYSNRRNDSANGEEEGEDKPQTPQTLPTLSAPHTRHNAMLGIAIRARAENIPAAEIESMLVAWAAEQNPTLIGSTEREVRRDAHRVAAWVWGKSFHPMREAKSDRRITVTHEEFATLVGLKNFPARLVGFLLLVATKLWGEGTLAVDRMEKITGFSHSTITDTLKYLVGAGVITKRAGRRVFDVSSKQMIREPNTYTYITPPSSRRVNAEGDDIGREADDINEADEFSIDISSVHSWSTITKAEFLDLYLRAIAENVGEERVYAQFTPRERDRLAPYYEEISMGRRKYAAMLAEQKKKEERVVHYVGRYEQDDD